MFIQNRHFTSYLFTYLFQNKMKCRFFLNSIIWQCFSFFKLFSCKNQSLLIWWNSFFLDFCFDCVNWINFECDYFLCECLKEDLHYHFLFIQFEIFNFLIKKWTSSKIHSNHQNLFNSSEQKYGKNNYTLFHINFKN